MAEWHPQQAERRLGRQLFVLVFEFRSSDAGPFHVGLIPSHPTSMILNRSTCIPITMKGASAGPIQEESESVLGQETGVCL